MATGIGTATLTACAAGSPAENPGIGNTGTVTVSDPAPPSPCPAEQLTAALEPGSPGAGQRYATLTLTNADGPECAVDGYGDLRLVDANDIAVPTDSWRTPDPEPVSVVLGAGESAQRLLHWTVVRGAGEPLDAPCQPEPARLEVTPPDRPGTVSVPWAFGPVCQHGWLGGGAFTAPSPSNP
ncbi:DUF4232 domain-containing protein [Saccharothrix sp. AJ9571]|nr:DUF4232 domain-containing protein [Saccharothrix sp. AJ9571]